MNPAPNSATVSPDTLFAGHLATLRQRADIALAETGFDGLVLPAGQPVEVPFDDQAFPFRSAPFYRWWSPHDGPDAWVCYRSGRKPLLAIRRTDDFWHLASPLPDAPWTSEFDIVELEQPAPPLELAGAGGRWAGIGEARCLPRTVTANPEPLLRRLEFDRAVKTPYEIACLRQANALGAQAHRAAQAAFEAGGAEFDVHGAFCAAVRQREQDLPYNAIVAIGAHASVLHYQHLDREPTPGASSLLIDAGVEYRGYASDITRTHAKRPGRFDDLVQGMDRLQRQLVASVHAGVDYVDVHLEAHRRIGALLQEAGIIRIGGVEAAETGLTSVFFPHGIGHLLGLQVHDAGGRLADRGGGVRPPPADHPFLRLTRRLEPGFVVTIEPGIYFIESLLARAAASPEAAHIDWRLVDELRSCGGIRVEDDVLVTGAEPENLTRQAFASLFT